MSVDKFGLSFESWLLLGFPRKLRESTRDFPEPSESPIDGVMGEISMDAAETSEPSGVDETISATIE